eukprot:354837-Chlamydomonas_euryale.AAC.1
MTGVPTAMSLLPSPIMIAAMKPSSCSCACGRYVWGSFGQAGSSTFGWRPGNLPPACVSARLVEGLFGRRGMGTELQHGQQKAGQAGRGRAGWGRPQRHNAPAMVSKGVKDAQGTSWSSRAAYDERLALGCALSLAFGFVLRLAFGLAIGLAFG